MVNSHDDWTAPAARDAQQSENADGKECVVQLGLLQRSKFSRLISAEGPRANCCIPSRITILCSRVEVMDFRCLSRVSPSGGRGVPHMGTTHPI